MSDILKEAKKFEHCYEYDWCKADAIIEGLLELIEENKINANHRYLDLQQVCDDQSKLIARLEAAYLEAIGPKSFDPDGCNCGMCQRKRKEARESLERIKAGEQG